MPLYEYECTECGQRTELLQRFGDPPLESCGECGGAMRKLFSAPAVQFKGTGWYVTDYAGKGKAPAAGADGGQKEAKAGKKKESSGSDSTASAKSDAKSSGSKESG